MCAIVHRHTNMSTCAKFIDFNANMSTQPLTNQITPSQLTKSSGLSSVQQLAQIWTLA